MPISVHFRTTVTLGMLFKIPLGYEHLSVILCFPLGCRPHKLLFESGLGG
jgi:hypothetical protein